MNDGKPFDGASAPKFAAASERSPATPSEVGDLDLRRRRLLRGAAGAAPVVLTLRSGALAAAASGCAATIVQTTLDANGVIQTPTDVTVDHVCVTTFSQCAGDPSRIHGGPVAGVVKFNPDPGGPKTCLTIDPNTGEPLIDPNTGQPIPLGAGNVAILSVNSVPSLVP